MGASDVLEHAPAVLGADRSTWRTVKFGDVVRSVKISVDPETSGLDRYVAGEHMDTGDLHIRRWGTVGDGYLGPAFHRKFTAGQVLYGSRRTYLRKVALADFDGICANTTFVLEPAGDHLLPKLLPFIMQTEAFTDHSVKNSKGSVNPYVNWGDIASFEFALPPKDEQRRISEVLWAADAAVSCSDVCVSATRTAQRTWFNGELASDDFLGQELSSLSWPLVSFGELMTSSPESGYSAPSVDRSTGYYVLSLAALDENGYKPGALKNVELTPEVQATRLQSGDLLISRSNTLEYVGFAGLFDEDRDDVSFPDTMMRLRIDKQRIDPRFLVRFLLSPAGRSQIKRIAAGTSASMKKLNRQGLRSLLIPLPPLENQLDIVSTLDVFRLAIHASATRRDSARELLVNLINSLLTAPSESGLDHVH